MTLTYFMARSTYVAYAFEWGKVLKCHLYGKLAGNGQMDLRWMILGKKIGPQGLSAPTPGQYTCILQ